MEPMGLREIARVPLSERVYRTLMELIADGSIPPGAELKEQHLAKQFNVSATPVREALKRLASDGMVEIIPYRGAVVRTLNKREIDEAYACREALEHLAVSEAIAHMEPQNIQELYGLTEAYRESADPSEICALSQQFDEYIYRMAQNHTLYELLGMLKGTISRDKKYSSANIERRAAIYEEHRAIVAAIESQDKERARQAVSNHIRNGRSFIEEKG
ncbi:MAG: GntR family transcriptional regulator [Oscillospiraceae bacterium]|jgi:DNA-binding GntR family transcriptional regulator|nr:GntR family transcriptional regulator [Oscillospiraceae bacterium]MCI9581665.1 GntR family transcriptional regulator [Oscillospiraceae bacterium]